MPELTKHSVRYHLGLANFRTLTSCSMTEAGPRHLGHYSDKRSSFRGHGMESIPLVGVLKLISDMNVRGIEQSIASVSL